MFVAFYTVKIADICVFMICSTFYCLLTYLQIHGIYAYICARVFVSMRTHCKNAECEVSQACFSGWSNLVIQNCEIRLHFEGV